MWLSPCVMRAPRLLTELTFRLLWWWLCPIPPAHGAPVASRPGVTLSGPGAPCALALGSRHAVMQVPGQPFSLLVALPSKRGRDMSWDRTAGACTGLGMRSEGSAQVCLAVPRLCHFFPVLSAL